MPTLYHIKPKDNGYHILGRSMTGEYFLIRKDSNIKGWKGELIFKSEKEAQEYINIHNLSNEYIPENFWHLECIYRMPSLTEEAREMLAKANVKIQRPIYCPDCDSELKCMSTIGADKSISGFSESLYHCESDDCANDFTIVRDTDGRFVKMTRHFWG